VVLHRRQWCGAGTWQCGAKTPPNSEIVEIAKLTGEFKKHYGKLIGAYLYLRSLSAARGRSLFWSSLIAAALSAALIWLKQHGWLSQLIP
jgi:hypothetical protein